MKIFFVSVAFEDNRYIEQQKRLIESIDKYHPDSEGFHWTNLLPPNSKPFLDSLYGFKVHAVQYALDQGYDKIMWLDPACILQDRIDFYFDLCKDYGVVAIQDDSKLVASDNALKFFGYGRSDLAGMHLVGGSMYAFHFPYSLPVFELWKRAERKGIFGSQNEEASGKLQGHRADESCMAFSLYKNGFKPLPYTGSRYNWDQNPAIIKKHFK
jgi:hypothetical protein